MAGYKNANELCIQLISLATGILVLSITFINEVLKKNPPTWALKISWGFFLVSILFGIMMMMAITGDIFQLTGDTDVAKALLYKSDPEKLKALTGEDDPKKLQAAMDEAIDTLTVKVKYKFNVYFPSGMQIITFIAGIVFLIAFGARTTMGKSRSEAPAAAAETDEFEKTSPRPKQKSPR